MTNLTESICLLLQRYSLRLRGADQETAAVFQCRMDVLSRWQTWNRRREQEEEERRWRGHPRPRPEG
jgi:hypothetical protein